MDERARKARNVWTFRPLTRVISQTGPGSWAHDRQFGVNAQCLGPAACTFVRAWLIGDVPVPGPQEDAAVRPTSQHTGGQTTTVTRRAAQSMADTNASGCYSRLLRDANILKNQQCRKASAHAEGFGKCLLLGMFGRGAMCCSARTGSHSTGEPLRLQRLCLAIFSRPRGQRGAPDRQSRTRAAVQGGQGGARFRGARGRSGAHGRACASSPEWRGAAP